jgi:acetylornithine deacetylase
VIGQSAALEGDGGHSSKADFKPKPLVTLAKLALALDAIGVARLHDGPAGMTGLCMNVAALHGGVAFNVIPQRGKLEWSLRPFPGFDRAAWDADLARTMREIDPAMVLATSVDHDPFHCDALAEAVRPYVAKVGSLDFWTEAALYQAHGIDAIVVGPGDIAQAHAADEFVTLEDLDWAVDLFQHLLRSAN